MKRIVVKVGTSTLCHAGWGLNFRRIDGIARALADIKNEGYEVALVTSGAMGAGIGKLKLPGRPDELRIKQAVSAVGQLELMHIYDKSFGEYGATVGQILLTHDAVNRPVTRKNLLGTFEALFELGVIPVVNENDSVAFEELESEHHKVFGDNDMLSAIVAELIGASMLIILSDKDGLLDSDPRVNPEAKLIPVVDEITPELEKIAGGVGSAFGTGGMATKLQAAKLATAAGAEVVIVNGAEPGNIYKALRGESVGTLFRVRRRTF